MKPIKLPPQLIKIIARVKGLGKHHYFIFSVLLLCGLTAAVYLVDITLSAPIDQVYHDQQLSQSLSSSFDQTTIKKIENLQKSDEHSATPPALQPGARTNPFAE